MMKKVLTILAMLITFTSVNALAAGTIQYDNSNGHTVSVSGIPNNDEVLIMVMKHGADITKINADASDVICFDQQKFQNNTLSFTVKLPNNEPVDIYAGYSSMADTDKPLSFISSVVTFTDATGNTVVAKLGTDSSNKIHSLPKAPVGESTQIFDKWKDEGGKTFTEQTTVTFDMVVHATYKTGSATPGDVNGDGSINSDDAIYLLNYTLDNETFPLSANGDVDNNGSVNSNDAIYLLKYTLDSKSYPIFPAK